MKVLIIDDEPLARSRMRHLLEKEDEVVICGEAHDVTTGKNRIEELQPDLIFLDIEMPGGTGFDLLDSLDSAVPHVVFTTAYSEYAVRAFEKNAVDYLLKPIDPEKLGQAIRRVLQRMENDDTPTISGSRESLEYHQQIFLRDGDACWFIKVSEIEMIESEGNYSRVYFRNDKPLIGKPLKYFETRLPNTCFFRCNRGVIVNLNDIRSVTQSVNTNLLFRMKSGREVEVSRRQSQLFRQFKEL